MRNTKADVQSSGKRPKFSTRTSIVSENRMREMEAYESNPIPHSDYRIILEDMVHMSIRRHERPFPLLKLQNELLLDLVQAEDTVSNYKKKLKQLQEENAPNDDIEFVKSELYKYKRLKYALRDVGDGIAWRFLNFERSVLSHLGNYPRKQHINRDGTAQELHEFADVINRYNNVAVLTDITHIFKMGDILAKSGEDSFEIVEVKSSKTKGRRLTRQKNNLIETLSFLNDGEKVSDGDIIRVLNLPLEPQSYMNAFEKLLIEAEKNCFLTEKIGEHLVLQITDFYGAKSDSSPDASFEELNKIIGTWRDSGDFVMKFSSVDRFSHVQNFAPFSVFPIHHKFRVRLMTGAILIQTYLNVSKVLKYLSERGWSVVKSPEYFLGNEHDYKANDIPIAALKKGPLTIHLPMPWVGRLAHEYLSIKTLGNMLDLVLKMGDDSANAIFFNLEGEANQWD